MRTGWALLFSVALVGCGIVTLIAGVDLDTHGAIFDYAHHSVQHTGAVNVVSAVLFDYRGLDTLGEATGVLATGLVVAVLAPKARTSMLSVRLSLVVLYGVALVLPFVSVLGFAVILFGHVSPGGGFTGGVVLASTAVFFAVVYTVGGQQSYVLPMDTQKRIENAAIAAFLLVGFGGLVTGGAFLANAATGIPLGEPGSLLSAGLIPLLNLVAGMKVGVGLAIVVVCLFSE